MTLGRIVLIVYAVLVGLGGVAGFVRASSKASLIAGLASAVLSLAAYCISLANEAVGYWIGAVVALAVGGRFLVAGMRSYKEGTFRMMPTGVVFAVSVVAVVLLTFAALRVGRS